MPLKIIIFLNSRIIFINYIRILLMFLFASWLSLWAVDVNLIFSLKCFSSCFRKQAQAIILLKSYTCVSFDSALQNHLDELMGTRHTDWFEASRYSRHNLWKYRMKLRKCRREELINDTENNTWRSGDDFNAIKTRKLG